MPLVRNSKNSINGLDQNLPDKIRLNKGDLKKLINEQVSPIIHFFSSGERKKGIVFRQIS